MKYHPLIVLFVFCFGLFLGVWNMGFLSLPQVIASRVPRFVVGKLLRKGQAENEDSWPGAEEEPTDSTATVSRKARRGAYPLVFIFCCCVTPYKKNRYKWLFRYFSIEKPWTGICTPRLIFNAASDEYWMFSVLQEKQKEWYMQPVFRPWNITSSASSYALQLSKWENSRWTHSVSQSLSKLE